jgi:hypothetical protein
MKASGMQTQSAEQILSKLQKDVKEATDKRETLESKLQDR